MEKISDFEGFTHRLTKAIYEKTNMKELAEKIGVAATTVSHWTKGSSYPSAEFLARLCVELDVSADYLIFGRR